MLDQLRTLLMIDPSMIATVACGGVLLAFIYSITRNRKLVRELLTNQQRASSERRKAQALTVELKENILALKDESRDLADLSFKLPSMMRKLTVDLERRSQGPLILNVLDEIFQPTQALVFLADDAEESLTLVAASGLERTPIEEGVRVLVGEGHVGFAARKQIVMDAHDFRLESNLERENIRRGELAGIRADYCAPLISNGRLLGAICMGMPKKWASVETKRLFGMVADVGALAIASHLQYREIRQLANSDPLTRIANKGYFMDKAAQILEDVRTTQRQTAVLMIDVDHFKRFNDSHGHLAGDRVLRGIGHILKQHVREGDIAARFGGEEFVVLLQASDTETAERVAERVRVAIRESDFDGVLVESSPRVTVSAGVAVFPEDGLELGDLIGRADEALYEAKEAGRDAVRRYGRATEDGEREGSPVEVPVAEAAPVEAEAEVVNEGAVDDAEPLEIPVEAEPVPTRDEQRALDILDALTGAIPVGYADESEEDEEDEEDEPLVLGATILEMTQDASEAS